MAIQYVIERATFGCPSHILNGKWTKFRKDVAALLFVDFVYDSIRAMAWIDTKAGKRAMDGAKRIEKTVLSVPVAKGHSVRHETMIGDFRVTLTIIN